jgi:Ca-activated chloride channel homolog
MTFAAPAWLLGLLVLPVLVWAYVVGRAHSTRYAVRFTAVSTLSQAALAEARWRRHLPAVLALAAVAALVLALARPHHTVRVPVGRASVMLVLDHSGSMQATDVQPTRLAAAKRAAGALIDELPAQVRVGVVAFSGAPDAIQPPTTDRAAARRAIDSQVAIGATATGDALELALQLLGSDAPGAAGGNGAAGGAIAGGGRSGADPIKRTDPAAIVLLSDGAANAGRYDPVQVAGEAGARRTPVYTVALGNADATIPNPSGVGNPVAVPPDPELLARIALASHGQAFTAQDEGRLISIYRRLGERLGSTPRSREITVVFILAGLVLLAGAGLTSLRWSGRLP